MSASATPTPFDLVVDHRPRVTASAPPLELVRLDEAEGGLWSASPTALAIKRGMDILGSAILMLVLTPIFALAAAAVAVTSPGGVLFRQLRVGADGGHFSVLKFRTMHADAEARRASLEADNECDGPVFKVRSDPRVTRPGRILRKLSIDELPQLWNVLRGDMSLVGPRPALPAEVEAYSARERLRLGARPGLTCIWQVSGRSDLDFQTWVDMDIDYLCTWSLWLDLKLLVRTVPAVLSGRGAY